MVFAILLPVLCGYTIAVIGLYINLKLPKFDWANEIMVIKQSMSVLITLFIGFIIFALPIIVYTTLLKTIMTIDMFIFLTTVLFMVFCFLVTKLLMTKGVKLYKKL